MMVAGVTTTTAIPVRSLSGVPTDEKSIAEALRNDPEVQAALAKSLEEAKQTAAGEIPDDSDVPSDVTDLLRQLDLLNGRIGSDNNPNAISLDGAGPIGPKFQDALAQLSLKVQAATAGKSDNVKGAILAYVSHALSLIDNKLQNNQDNFSLELAAGNPQQILPNGKGQVTNAFDEVQTQRDNIKNTLNSLLGSSGSLGDVVDQFSKVGYAGLRASLDDPSAGQDYSAALKTLSDTVAGLKAANSDFEKSFLTHLANDFGKGLNTTFTQEQSQLARGLATATDSDTINAIKALDDQLDSYKDLTTNTFAKLLQQLSGSENQQASSKPKTGLFFNVKA
jgi:hypothetical protein